MKKNWILLAVITAAVLLLPELLSACPNCKEAYLADGQTPVSSGFNTSIYFMMAMPFLVFGGFTLRLWLAQRHRNTDGSQA
ncbi:MAG: hypothetical protein WBQ23_16210 [Bacteroidota bacterium]